MADALHRSVATRVAFADAPFPGGFQQTLSTSVRCSGVALHCGAPVEMAFHPAEAGAGIVFRRTDLVGDAALVAARWDAVVPTPLCTTLRNGYDVRISTVEHVMAALAACEIDNVLIDLDGPEPPAMDGSAVHFVNMLRTAGVVRQCAPRNVLRVCKPVAVGDRDRFACLLPAEEFSVECEIEFDSPAIGRQSYRYSTGDNFDCDVAPARTFGLLRDVDAMRRMGFARGGSLDNAVVVDGDRVLNETGLRYADEFVRHKVLDAVGDLYLLGTPILGRFRGYHSGHELNNAVLRALLMDPSAWAWAFPGGPNLAGERAHHRLV